MSDENPIFTFVTRRTVGEIWRVYFAATVNKASLVASIALIFAGLALIFVASDPSARWLIPVLLALCFAVPVGRHVSLYRQLAGNPAVTAETTVTVYDWGVQTATSLHDRSFTWDMLNGFKITRRHIHVFVAPARVGLVWPKRDIEAAHVGGLVAILSRHLTSPTVTPN